MPLPPQHHRHAPLPSFLRRQEPNLANADQNLTALDTRLPKLDTVNPRSNPQPQQNHNHTRHPQRQPSLPTPPTHPEQT